MCNVSVQQLCTIVCVVYSIFGVVCAIPATPTTCTTPGCKKAAAAMSSYMDESVNPCDDFYDFACGKFKSNHVLPEDKCNDNAFTLTIDKVVNELEAILTKEPLPNESEPFRLAKNFTKTCLDEKTLNEKGVAPMVEILERYGGWPIVKGNNWLPEKWDWFDMTKRIARDGLLELILSLSSPADLKNSSRRILTISPAPIGLARKFLLQGMEHAFVKSYYDFMVDSAVIFGANRSNAEIEFLDVLQFEIELAKILLTEEECRNATIIYNLFTIQQLQSTYPFIDWLEFVNSKLNGIIRVNDREIVNVPDKNYLQQLNGIFQSTSKRTIANYYAWRLAYAYSHHLNDELHERSLQYYTATTGVKKLLPRLTKCVKLTSNYLSISVAAIYIREYFNSDTKVAATTLAKTIQNQFFETLKTVPWIDDASRRAATIKANRMMFHIAYPDELNDTNKLEELHRGLQLAPDSLINSLVNFRKFYTTLSIKKLRKPIDKLDWEKHSTRVAQVNAFYSNTENSVQLPAGILQNPFFSVDRPSYMNFGAIGWLIAHEITHGFDDVGRQFDSNGNVENWWKEETITKFTAKAKCFIDQYSNYKHPTLNLTLNGVNTLGENIADNAAVKMIYQAYQNFVRQNGSEPVLPGFNHYTPNQLFWISAAQTWCQVTRPEFDTFMYTTNAHAHGRYRVNGPLSNTQYFSNDFNCPVGSKMNPVHKCEMW